MRMLAFALVAILSTSFSSTMFCAEANTASAKTNSIIIGEKIAFNRKKGNCLACHAIRGGKLPGNIGPPLINMKQRYPNKARLKAQIEDARENNPNSIMPPYKKHKILSEVELNMVVDFIYSL